MISTTHLAHIYNWHLTYIREHRLSNIIWNGGMKKYTVDCNIYIYTTLVHAIKFQTFGQTDTKVLDEALIQFKMKSLINLKDNVQNMMIHCQSRFIMLFKRGFLFLFLFFFFSIGTKIYAIIQLINSHI